MFECLRMCRLQSNTRLTVHGVWAIEHLWPFLVTPQTLRDIFGIQIDRKVVSITNFGGAIMFFGEQHNDQTEI